MISVIMPTYCRVRSIDKAIDSILSQTYTDFELLIMDDGSTDGTKEILQDYAKKDSRIKHIRFEENSGTPALRGNQGIALSQGTHIAFMFDDDLWYPHCLDTLYSFHMANPDCGMIYGQIDYHNLITGQYRANFGEDWDYSKLINGNYIPNHAVLIKREVFKEIGGYDEHPVMKRICDWDLWCRMGKHYQVKRIPVSVGKGYAGNPDSIGNTVPLNLEAIYIHQRTRSKLPNLF